MKPFLIIRVPRDNGILFSGTIVQGQSVGAMGISRTGNAGTVSISIWYPFLSFFLCLFSPWRTTSPTYARLFSKSTIVNNEMRYEHIPYIVIFNIPGEIYQKHISYYDIYTCISHVINWWIMIHRAAYAIYEAQTPSDTHQSVEHLRIYIM